MWAEDLTFFSHHAIGKTDAGDRYINYSCGLPRRSHHLAVLADSLTRDSPAKSDGYLLVLALQRLLDWDFGPMSVFPYFAAAILLISSGSLAEGNREVQLA